MDAPEHDQRSQRNRALARAERIGEAGSVMTAPVLSSAEDLEAFVNVGRWSWDIATGALTCSPQLVRLYGLASASLMPNADSFLLHTHQSDRMRVRAAILRAQSTGEPFQFQQRIVRMDDAIRVFRTRGSIERGPDGKAVRIVGMSQDITEPVNADQQAQQRFRQTSLRAFNREETEKSRIVKELRERVAEPLVSLGRSLTASNDDGSVAREINSVATATMQLMGQLRPSVLEEHGLLAALRAEGLRIGRQAAIPVSVSGEEITPRLPIAAETALFRIGQEAMANSARHASCTLIRISLSGTPHHTRLEIQDNGAGFDTASLAGEAGGVQGGLAVMRERAEAVSATFRLSSQPGSGVRITVEYRG